MLYIYDRLALQGHLELIKASVLAGEVIAFPTDTLYALACDATNDRAIEKLFAIKKRSMEKTAPVLVGSIPQAFSLGKNSNIAYNLAARFWPGALTLVLEVFKENRPLGNLASGSQVLEFTEEGYNMRLSKLAIRDGTVALRMPNNDMALDIIKACGVPLLGSSANISGSAALNDADEIYNAFRELAFVIKTDVKVSGKASTIVKISDENIEIIRAGGISEEEIMRI